MTSLFISYSRKDIDMARKLTRAFKSRDWDFWIDWEGIPPTVDWWKQIEKGIEEADMFLFLLSPNSAKSKVCALEVEHAVKNGKRLIPIVVREMKGEEAPKDLTHLNWIFLRENDEFSVEFEKLISAIKTDYEWVQAHRQLQVKALEWARNNKENSFLLRGKELQAAELQLAANSAKAPLSTDLQQEYVSKSRQATARQRKRVLSVSIAGLIIIAGLAYAPIQNWLDDPERSGWKTLQVDPLVTPSQNMILSLNPWNVDELYVASASNGNVSRTMDGGTSWNITTITAEDGIYGLATARGRVYAITRRAVFHSTDKGENWKVIATPDLGTDQFQTVAVNPQDPNQAFVGTSSGMIIELDNSGSIWKPLSKEYDGNTVSALVTNGRVLLAATENGVWVHEVGQSTWKPVSLLGCNGIEDPSSRVTSLAMPLATDREQIGIWAAIPGLGVCDSDYENRFNTSFVPDIPYGGVLSVAILGDPIQNRNIYLVSEQGLVTQRTWHWTDNEWWWIKLGLQD